MIIRRVDLTEEEKSGAREANKEREGLAREGTSGDGIAVIRGLVSA
jgi:hypothetical protein